MSIWPGQQVNMHFAMGKPCFWFLLTVGLSTASARKEIDHEHYRARNQLTGAAQFNRLTSDQHASVDGPSSERSLIFGGTPAAPNEFPFFAVTPTTEYSGYGCGAVLIHPDILLTAATCSSQIDSGVVVNAQNRTDKNDGERLFVKLLVMHPLYDSNTFSSYENDLMIVKLLHPSSQTPASVNRNASNPKNIDSVTVIGMGFNNTYFSSPISETLLKATASLVDYDTCNGTVGGIVDASMFCTGKGKGECYGDGGNPVLDVHGTLIGIASQTNCDYSPSVHTRVSYYTKWIDEMICTYSDMPPAGCSKGNYTSPQPPGTVKVIVSTKEDPSYATFTLVDANDNEMFPHKENENVIVLIPYSGENSNPGAWKNETFYLTPSRYTFGMYGADSYGDEAMIFVHYGGGSISKLADFGTSDPVSYPFWLAGGDYQPLQGNVSAPAVNVTLKVSDIYCQYVFAVKDMYTNQVVYQSTLDDCSSSSDSSFQASFNLVDGRSYVFSSQSTYAFNQLYGYYQAVATYPGQGPGLLFSGSDIGDTNSMPFVLELPSCHDKKKSSCTTAAGMVDGSAQKKLYCKIPSVKNACPYSCGTCFV